MTYGTDDVNRTGNLETDPKSCTTKSGETPSTKFDLYQTVTDQIVQAIEESRASGIDLPWYRGGGTSLPINAVTGQAYRGVNVLSFWAAAEIRGFATGHWATYKQWQSIGAQVRKGETSTVGVFYKKIVPTRRNHDETRVVTGDGTTSQRATAAENGGDPRPFLFAKSFRVFNADQVDGYEADDVPGACLVARIERAERLVDASGASVCHGGARAFYDRVQDRIRMPDPERFRDTGTSTATEGYYGVLFHEMTHWTGHGRRLDRDLNGRFGDAAYAMEELVAELGSAYLAAALQLTPQPRPDHAGYIATWLRALKSDSRGVFTAAARASEAADFIVGLADVHV